MFAKSWVTFIRSFPVGNFGEWGEWQEGILDSRILTRWKEEEREEWSFLKNWRCKSKSPILQIFACDSHLPIIYLLSVHMFCISSPSSDVIPLLQPESLSTLSPLLSLPAKITPFPRPFSVFLYAPARAHSIFASTLIPAVWAFYILFGTCYILLWATLQLSSWVVLLYNSPTGVQRARPAL